MHSVKTDLVFTDQRRIARLATARSPNSTLRARAFINLVMEDWRNPDAPRVRMGGPGFVALVRLLIDYSTGSQHENLSLLWYCDKAVYSLCASHLLAARMSVTQRTAQQNSSVERHTALSPPSICLEFAVARFRFAASDMLSGVVHFCDLRLLLDLSHVE